MLRLCVFLHDEKGHHEAKLGNLYEDKKEDVYFAHNIYSCTPTSGRKRIEILTI